MTSSTNTFLNLYNQGQHTTIDKTVIICSMVRDCGKELNHNINAIENIASYFEDYRVVILENNSVDSTKDVLKNWANRNKKVNAYINDFDEAKYKKIEIDYTSSPYFRLAKIQKYVDYRNLLLDKVDSISFNYDYLIMVDLDVASINPKGVISSFGFNKEWDAITANGYSHSIYLRRRFHDTYPLCECGNQSIPQSLDKLYKYRCKYASLKRGMQFVRVFSAYGGLAIYKSSAIKGLRYKVIFNNSKGIQVRCEHFSLYYQMAANGYDKVFINPNMEILYQKINRKSITRYITNYINRIMEKQP